MNPSGYLLLGLTAVVAALSAVLAYALVKFMVAAREMSKSRRHEGGDSVLMASALEDAVRSLRAQERAMKARAEASERLSEQIVASLTSGLLVVDQAGIVRTLNPAGRRLLGVGEGDVERPFRELLAHTPELAALIEECLARGGAVGRRTVKTFGAGPAVTHLGASVSPMHGEDVGGTGVICLFTDLSTVVGLEDQLRLKDSLARLGELTAGIAHEFRNGLATIHGYGRLVAPERLPEDYRPYLAGIRSETEELGQIVTNFLNFARPADLVLAPFDMAAIVERATDDVRQELQARAGEVIIRGRFGTINGDEVLLRQAVSNLLRNAVEACVDAGVPPRIAIDGEVDAEAGVLRVTVSDNGPGIAPDVAERMFRPFFTTKGKGTGLGLALVQKIIVTHNGRVAAVPSEEGGARLSFTLPLADG